MDSKEARISLILLPMLFRVLVVVESKWLKRNGEDDDDDDESLLLLMRRTCRTSTATKANTVGIS